MTGSFPISPPRPTTGGSDVLPPWKQGELVSETSYTSRTSVSTSVTQLAQEQGWEQKVTEVRMWSLGTPWWWIVALFVYNSFQLKLLWLNILKIKKKILFVTVSSFTFNAQEATGGPTHPTLSLRQKKC